VLASGFAYIQSFGAPALDHGVALTMSPDGEFVYVSSYSGIEVSRRDAMSGLTTIVGEASIDSTTYYYRALAITPDGKHLYASQPASTSPWSELYVYERDPATGLLTEVEDYVVPTGANVAISPDGAHVYVPGSDDGSLTVFARNAATGELTFVETQREGQAGVTGLSGVARAVVSPDGAHVYAVGLTPGSIAAFSRNTGTGALTFVGSLADETGGITGLAGAAGITLSGDGAFAYVQAHTDKAVTVFSRDAGTGVLTQVAVSRDGVGDVPAGALNNAYESLLSPDGTELWVSGLTGELTVFARDVGTGALTFDTTSNTVGHADIASSPDGRFLYRTDHPSGAIYQHVSVSCSTAPLSGCRQPTVSGSAKLTAKRGSTPERSKLKWIWSRGEDTADFGTDPLVSTDFALCVYAGGVQRMQALAPAGGVCGSRSCWKRSSSGAYKYADSLETPDGMKKLALVPGTTGRSRITATLGTELLRLPPFPLAPPITVQLANSDGDCWSATYSSAIVYTGTDLKALSD
jgi:6-phosphogluconolactonase (cycloisomerase 2 family)